MRPGLRFTVLTRDNYTCRYCGAQAPDVKLHVDHVVPKSRGGLDEMANLVTACQRCNQGKHATLTEQARPAPTMDEYRARMDSLLELVRSSFWMDMAGIWDEWEEMTGRRASERESLHLAESIVWYGFNGVRRAMHAIAGRDGVYPGSGDTVDMDVFEIRQTLKRWRADGLA